MPTIDVLDSTMSYRESGGGAVPLVFLHGNPTSSYLWRKVISKIGSGRILAPDLIGMGDSGKPEIDYSFADHARYLDAWIEELALDSMVFVGHDWGGALAFDWAARHPGRARGVAFLETIVRPMDWEEFPESARPVFSALRTPGVGEARVLEQNSFIEGHLPNTVMTGLAPEDLDVYRKPYPTPESRRPLLAWPRALPLGGEPTDVVTRVEAYDTWLAASGEVPKLLLTFGPGPGLMVSTKLADWCRDNIASLEVVACGPSGHHAPEDQPDAIADAVASWVDRHRLRSPRTANGTSSEIQGAGRPTEVKAG